MGEHSKYTPNRWYIDAIDKLGKSHSQMGEEVFGLEGNGKQKSLDIARGKRRLSGPMKNLVQAYLDGYRPQELQE